jgi:NhaP-type Na+/H+ or K+/H+ antiporter
MPMAVVMYLVIHAVRFAVIFSFSPMLNKLGYGLTPKEAGVMVYSGLRGAVSLAMVTHAHPLIACTVW